MFIIIEGCDKCGKTTLVNKISKDLNIKVIDDLPIQNNDMFLTYFNFMTSASEIYILDRWAWSEMVYGPIKRNNCRLDIREFILLELLCKTFNTFNIYATDDEERIKQRFITDKEEYLDLSDISKITEGYEKIIANSCLTWHNYIIGYDMDLVVSKIKSHIDSLNIEQIKDYVKRGTVGNIINPEYLIVGERYGEPVREPLIPFGRNNPGLLLFESLLKSKMSCMMDRVMITNAYKVINNGGNYEFDAEQSKKSIIEETSIPSIKKIICLGNSSYEYVNAFLKPFAQTSLSKIFHPSFWLRYSGKPAHKYVDIINSAL